jgi:TPP-dependent pyruvate/acetoin dehydrogenase alpha subunit
MVAWRARDPVVRFRHWLVSSGWWDEAQEKQLRHTTRQQVRCKNVTTILMPVNFGDAVNSLEAYTKVHCAY